MRKIKENFNFIFDIIYIFVIIKSRNEPPEVTRMKGAERVSFEESLIYLISYIFRTVKYVLMLIPILSLQKKISVTKEFNN